MEDPPPPYSEVLGVPRGNTYTKPASGTSRKPQDGEPSKPGLAERPFSALIRLPTDQNWDSLGRLLSAMDLNLNLNRNNLPRPAAPPALSARTNSDLGLEPWALPTAFPLLGRSTAV